MLTTDDLQRGKRFWIKPACRQAGPGLAGLRLTSFFLTIYYAYKRDPESSSG